MCKRSHQLKILSLQLKIKSLHNGIKIDIKSVDFKPCTFAILEIINEISKLTTLLVKVKMSLNFNKGQKKMKQFNDTVDGQYILTSSSV